LCGRPLSAAEEWAADAGMDLGSEQKGEVDAMLEQVCKHVTCCVLGEGRRDRTGKLTAALTPHSVVSFSWSRSVSSAVWSRWATR
jgi:hypothetical protein